MIGDHTLTGPYCYGVCTVHVCTCMWFVSDQSVDQAIVYGGEGGEGREGEGG